MTEQEYEAYFFEKGEFGNVENIKDILRSHGEQRDDHISLGLEDYEQEALEEFDLNDRQIIAQESYDIDGDVEIGFYRLRDGLMITSNSNYLLENSRSIPSRSSNEIHK